MHWLMNEYTQSLWLYVDNRKFNVDSVQHDKRCYFSLLAEAVNIRKRASASREVLLVLRQQIMTEGRNCIVQSLNSPFLPAQYRG